MRYAVLGPLEVHGESGPIALTSDKQRRLLALLILRHGRGTPADTIIEALWNGTPPGSVGKAVSWHIMALRKSLGGKHTVTFDANGYRLAADPEDVDAVRFERAVGSAADRSPARAESTLDRALALWRGPAYADLADVGELRDEADRLDELRLSVVEERNRLALDLGRHAALVPDLTRLVAEQPYREVFRAQLMVALYRCGRQADALRIYREGRALMDEELGLEPGLELRRLEHRVLTEDPELLAPEAPPSTVVVPAQLPYATTAFTGREAEASLLVHDAARGGQAVRVIDGMAGVGKTTLALHIAHQLAGEYPDGQLFVDLHGFSGDVEPVGPARVLDRFLHDLDVSTEDLSPDVDTLAASFRTAVAGRRLIILLDNAGSEDQVAPLIPGTGDHLVLVTSRRRLVGLDDAQHLHLPPVDPTTAVDMFVALAHPLHVDDTDRAVIGDIVAMCGYLPLAMRVAAAQLRRRRGWTLAGLRDRLDDERGRLDRLRAGSSSVSAAFELSLRALGSDESELFGRLGLLTGPSFDRYTAAALTGQSPDRAAELLGELADVGLVEELADDRYGFHDLLRGFAAQRSTALTVAHRDAARERVLALYLRAARAAATAIGQTSRALPLPGEFPGVTVPVIDSEEASGAWYRAERANLSALIVACAEAGNDEYTWQLVECLKLIGLFHSHYGRLLDVLPLGLDAARRLGDRRAEALIRTSFAWVYTGVGRYAEAETQFRSSGELWREVGNHHGHASVLQNLGVLYQNMARMTDALAALHAAADALDRDTLADRSFQALIESNLTGLYLEQDRIDDAARHADRMRVLVDPTGNRHQIARADSLQGTVARCRGDLATAVTLHGRARDHFAVTEQRYGLAGNLNELGNDHRELGNPDTALEYHHRALELARQTRHHGQRFQILNDLARSYTALGDLTAADDAYREVVDDGGPDRSPVDLAEAHHGAGLVARLRGDEATARVRLTEAARLFEEIGSARAAAVRRLIDAARPVPEDRAR